MHKQLKLIQSYLRQISAKIWKNAVVFFANQIIPQIQLYLGPIHSYSGPVQSSSGQIQSHSGLLQSYVGQIQSYLEQLIHRANQNIQ